MTWTYDSTGNVIRDATGRVLVIGNVLDIDDEMRLMAAAPQLARALDAVLTIYDHTEKVETLPYEFTAITAARTLLASLPGGGEHGTKEKT